jgi:hypothetical protein
MNAQALTGRVVRPGDSYYAEASRGWNHFFTHKPAAVVFAHETEDVVNALAWARQNGVPFRVRSGGHALEGWSGLDDGLVIDVSGLKSVTIDGAASTATVGAGLNQGEVVIELGTAGFAAPTGTEGSVGLAGATLGGGFGLLTRNYGMASDNLLSAEVVVASTDGGAEVVTADERNNPDLLWALRGAGNGNFGIVTSMTYRIHPLAQAIFLVASWTGLDDFEAVFEAWQRSAPYADNRLTSQLEIEGDRFAVHAALAPGSEAEAVQMLSAVLSIGSPDVVVQDGSWPEIYAGFQIPIEVDPANWKFNSQFITEPLSPEAIRVISAFLAKAPAGCNYFTNAFGGAVRTSEPSGGSAFAHRDALYYAEDGCGPWVGRGVLRGDGAVRQRCVCQRAQCRYGGLGTRLLGFQCRAAAQDQSRLRPGQCVLLRAERSAGLGAVDEVREERGQPACAEIVEPRPEQLDGDAHHLRIGRPDVLFELGEFGSVHRIPRRLEVLLGDPVDRLQRGEATHQQRLGLFRSGAAVDGQGNLRTGRKSAGFRGGRRCRDDDALPRPVEPNRDDTREAVMPVVGQPSHSAGKQLLCARVAKLASQLLGIHHTDTPTRISRGSIREVGSSRRSPR